MEPSRLHSYGLVMRRDSRAYRGPTKLASLALSVVALVCASCSGGDVYDQCGRWGDYTFLCWPGVIEQANGFDSCRWNVSNARGGSGVACEDTIFGTAPPQQAPTRECLACILDAVGASCDLGLLTESLSACCAPATYDSFESGWIDNFAGEIVCDGYP